MKTIAETIENSRQAVETACRENAVRALWVFGSAARPDYNPATSDIDFLVELAADRSPASQFFGLYRSLAEIFDERIDLVSLDGVSNPLFRGELERTRIPIYAAA